MPANRHIRHDVVLAARLIDGQAELRLAANTLLIPRRKLAPPSALIVQLERWNPLVMAASHTSVGVQMTRLALRLEQADLAEIDWEGALAAIAKQNVLAVRVTDVHPRVAQRLFDFPARILALGKGDHVAAAIGTVLDGTRSDYAMVVKTASPQNAEREVEEDGWPDVDVLHFQSEAELLLTRTDGEDPGSVRWLLRRCDRWRTRLIVIEADEARLAKLRRAAYTIVASGGPAVFVFQDTKFEAVGFYADLLHDRPLDWIRYDAGGALFAGSGREEALRFSAVASYLASPQVVKALRIKARRAVPQMRPKAIRRIKLPERPVVMKAVRESARVVNLKIEKYKDSRWEHPAKFMRLGDVIASKMLDHGYVVEPLDVPFERLRQSAFTIDDFTLTVRKHAMSLDYVLDPRTPPRLETLVAARLKNMRESESRFSFDDSEARGTLPLAAKATALRKLLRSGRKAESATPKPRGPRHVNTQFYRTKPNDVLEPIPQPRARLTPGKVVHLGIRIGQKDWEIEDIGALVFAEESIPWTPEMTGAWIEVALTPIDFENVGEPVQEFWLPRDGGAALVTFAVRPGSKTTVPGVARLRFTLYHRNNILQSFRLAALLEGAAVERKAALSAALGADPSRLGKGDAGYLTRLEYSACEPTAAAELPERTLSIVANESAGEKIFSIKSKDFFSTTVNQNVGDHVKNVRDALGDASRNKNGEYLYEDDNSGTEKDLLERLWPIAEEGWGLYFSILPDPDERKSAAELLGQGGTIHAAHIDLRQLVAWSLIYDRKVDSNHNTHFFRETNTRVPVDRAVCLAGFPDDTGKMPPGECITDPKCILAEKAVDAQIKKTGRMVCPETVICPRRFWGFMHQIEVPAQQAEAGKATKPMPQAVSASKPIGVLAGFNPNVKRFKTHLPEVESTVTKWGKAAFLAKLDRRDDIVQSFDEKEPDIVYLYCHAYPDTLARPKRPNPNLDFGARQPGEFILVREIEGKKWGHAPLVFLNACGVVGFSVDAPSEFITAFVQARHAAAVIGTEITVWEELATEVAINFLGDFLDDKPAGEALLRARRVLLAKYNPLGLVYTLYGSAGLHLA